MLHETADQEPEMADSKLLPTPACDRIASGQQLARGQGESFSAPETVEPLPPILASLVGAWRNQPIGEADYREHLERKHR